MRHPTGFRRERGGRDGNKSIVLPSTSSSFFMQSSSLPSVHQTPALKGLATGQLTKDARTAHLLSLRLKTTDASPPPLPSIIPSPTPPWFPLLPGFSQHDRKTAPSNRGERCRGNLTAIIFWPCADRKKSSGTCQIFRLIAFVECFKTWKYESEKSWKNETVKLFIRVPSTSIFETGQTVRARIERLVISPWHDSYIAR